MPAGDVRCWDELMDQPRIAPADFACEQVAFDHPLWILFSSGTTGLPKPIVHGHGGILLEHLKHLHFNYEATRGHPLFFFTTTSWMMWNFLLSSLAADVIPVLYDGNPAYPGPDALWKVIEESGATLFGTSPSYIDLQRKAGVVPKERFDLSRLESVTLAGSPVSAECMQWIYENVKADLWVASGSGGTDCCTGFVGGVSMLPVYAGEIQARALGCAAFAFDEQGREIVDEVGELVITQPMPSMPVKFWNDPEDQRYRESYFDLYPGIWRHGDFVRFNQRGGVYVLGRSDSTLNRHGIRIGTAEIYRSLALLEEIDDALIVNLDLPGGKFFMPLFVKLRGDRQLDEPLDPAHGRATAPRLFAAPRAGQDLPGAGDSLHAHRQEARGAHTANSHGRGSGQGGQPRGADESGCARLLHRLCQDSARPRAQRRSLITDACDAAP